eukprot:TRINITY_DN76474_c0_g1_i1.p1 TRINITY_DN76474_c0_g1~~TRINITY_DN76474_c0_g1_i1.p1  ORF type:complete len:124 (-),score=13.86 TRINITY_DN76474_c0_g1_i1:138-509(-)
MAESHFTSYDMAAGGYSYFDGFQVVIEPKDHIVKYVAGRARMAYAGPGINGDPVKAMDWALGGPGDNTDKKVQIIGDWVQIKCKTGRTTIEWKNLCARDVLKLAMESYPNIGPGSRTPDPLFS